MKLKVNIISPLYYTSKSHTHDLCECSDKVWTNFATGMSCTTLLKLFQTAHDMNCK